MRRLKSRSPRHFVMPTVELLNAGMPSRVAEHCKKHHLTFAQIWDTKLDASMKHSLFSWIRGNFTGQLHLAFEKRVIKDGAWLVETPGHVVERWYYASLLVKGLIKESA